MNDPVYFTIRFDPSQAKGGGGVYVEYCGTSAKSAAVKFYGLADEDDRATLYFCRWTAVCGLEVVDNVNNFSVESLPQGAATIIGQLLEASIRYGVMHAIKADSKIVPGTSLN